MRLSMLIVFLSVVTSFIAGCGQQQVSFSKDVQPLLNASCLHCHDGVVGEGSEKTDFIITDYDNVMKGTQYGPVVKPGDSLSSTLYRVLSHLTDPKIQMPPHHKVSTAEGRSEPLKHEQIEVIKNWIDQGAKNN